MQHLFYLLFMNRRKGSKKGSKYNENHAFPFGKILHSIRKKRGLTQPELAEKMGSSVRTVSYYEREAKNPTMEMIEKFAKALNVPVKAFIDKSTANKVEAVPQVIRPLKQRLTKLATLPRKEQEHLVSVIDGSLAKQK